MKIKSILFFSFLVSFISCATHTKYKASEKISIHTIGFTDLTADSILERIHSGTNEVFRATVPKAFEKFGMNSVIFIENKLNYFHPDTILLRKICREKNLDGLVISKLKFLSHMSNLDSEITLSLFDKEGRLFLSTSYNSAIGKMWKERTADSAIKMGTEAAIKRMMKEMNSSE